MANSNAPHAVLEIGGTSFNTFKALRTLITSVSQDDVQPQAVLAVEALGSIFLASADRINEAVDALGGNDSVRVENVLASIGLTSGGLRHTTRKSTGLLQFFLVCTMSKLCFIDEECATLAFEMLKTSGLLAKYPVATSQLTRLVNQLSGHAEAIVPVDLMTEIASKLDEYQPDTGVFARMNLKVLSELLVRLFESVRDESIDSITLVGHDHAVWLAPSLLWLLGDDAWLLIGEDTVKGDPRSKLCVQIEPKSSEPWKLQIWKTSKDPIEYVFDYDKDESDTLRRIPLGTMKSYLNQYYWEAFETPELRKMAMIRTGQVAQSLILTAVKRGKVYMQRSCCKPQQRCSETKLADFAGTAWLSTTGQLIADYGWDGTLQLQQSLLTDLERSLSNWDQINVNERTYEEAEKCIKSSCGEFIKLSMGPETEVDYILDPAMFIAANAIVTCTCSLKNGRRYITPMDDQSIEFAEKTIIHVLSDGLDISEFRRAAFLQLLPGLEIMHAGDLVVAWNGYVVGMSILWEPTVRQDKVFGIRMARGQIRKDEISYDSIREIPFNSTAGSSARQPLVLDKNHRLLPPEVGWNSVLQERLYKFDTIVSVSSSRLELKQYMSYTDELIKQPFRRKASWIAAINVLATAYHMKSSNEFTFGQQEALASRLGAIIPSSGICWTEPFASPKVEEGIKSIIRTAGFERVKIFAAGVCNEFSECCCAVVVSHEAPLLQCIARAEELRSTWLIVY